MNPKPYTHLDQLPLTLNAGDLSNVLGISRAQAYNLLKSEDFPTLRIGRRILVPKHSFIYWLTSRTGGAA